MNSLIQNEMFNPHKNVLIKSQTYKYKRPSMNWVLVKIPRAQTHRIAHCVSSGRIEGKTVDWEGVSGYNTESLTLHDTPVVGNMFEECHASC